MLAKNSSFLQHHLNSDIYISKCNCLQYIFRFDGYYMYSFLLVLMLNIALSLLTTFSNIIIIHVIHKNHRALNSPSISLYVYTAFAGLLLSIIGLPLWISYQILAYYRKTICDTLRELVSLAQFILQFSNRSFMRKRSNLVTGSTDIQRP